MGLEMKAACERCTAPLPGEAAALVCSFECTFCPACAAAMASACPNCGGELLRRPRRTAHGAADGDGMASPSSPPLSDEADEAISPIAYQPRPVRSLGLWEHEGWRIKLYALADVPREPSPALLKVAKAAARQALPRPAVTGTRYGVGYLGVHECAGSDYAFFGWWERGNELYHHLLVTADRRRGVLEDETARGSGLTGCVWELGIADFERRAWIRHGMGASRMDRDGYLAERLDGWV